MTVAFIEPFQILEERPDGRVLLRFVEGAMAGRTVLAFPDHECLPNYQRRLTPKERAEALLCSLLDLDQQASRKRTGQFRVGTCYGMLELGRMHDIGFWPPAGGELRLCVVPAGRTTLPEPDVWTNLLLVLRADPEHFFSVANWRRLSGPWFRPPVPGLDGRGQ